MIITTNYINYLDKVLIRPSCIDKKVKLRLTNSNIVADLFCLVFKPIIGVVAPLYNT